MYISSVSLPVNEPYQTLVSLRKYILCGYDNVTFSFLFLGGGGPGKRCFPAVTGYFVKMNSFPKKPPTDYLCTVKRFITVLYGRTSKLLHEHRHC